MKKYICPKCGRPYSDECKAIPRTSIYIPKKTFFSRGNETNIKTQSQYCSNCQYISREKLCLIDSENLLEFNNIPDGINIEPIKGEGFSPNGIEITYRDFKAGINIMFLWLFLMTISFAVLYFLIGYFDLFKDFSIDSITDAPIYSLGIFCIFFFLFGFVFYIGFSNLLKLFFVKSTIRLFPDYIETARQFMGLGKFIRFDRSESEAKCIERVIFNLRITIRKGFTYENMYVPIETYELVVNSTDLDSDTEFNIIKDVTHLAPVYYLSEYLITYFETNDDEHF